MVNLPWGCCVSSFKCGSSQRRNLVSVRFCLLLGAFIFAVALPVMGANLTVQNPSFEDEVLSPGEATGNGEGLAPWTTSPGEAVGVWDVSNLIDFPGGAPAGNNVAYSQGPSISQDLPYVVVEGNSYQLTLQVGTSPCCSFPGYSVQLRADGVTLAEDAAIVFGPAPGTFETVTLNYESSQGDSNAGNQLEIFLQAWGPEIVFDQIILTSAGAVSEVIFNDGFEAIPNRAPEIISTPVFNGQVGVPHHYDAEASDADGDLKKALPAYSLKW